MKKISDNINLNIDEHVKRIQQQFGIIGRENELRKILLAYFSKRNILIEGEVGTGKTTLARAFANYMDKNFYRVDGSEDVLSHVLVGYFDPPLVIAKGYCEEAFLYGPLTKAMKNGDVLFINELNRIPESTQNVLLSSLDEGFLDIPKLSPIYAKEGFITIATMNPSEHVGTTNLGSALKDRFVWIYLDYQSIDEESKLIKQKLFNLSKIRNFEYNDEQSSYISRICAKILYLSRNHKDIRRGASIRAGIDLASIIYIYSLDGKNIMNNDKIWLESGLMALETKIEIQDSIDRSINSIIQELIEAALKDF